MTGSAELAGTRAQAATETREPGSLRGLVLRGSVWTLSGTATRHVLRLVGNLVLTRLLFPEAFGLLTLVHLFLTGLQMFSDVGIRPSIVQNERGDDPDFLDTAWTIQAVRGGALCLLSILLAPFVATFYGEPLLAQLIPAIGFTAVFQGFASTNLHTADRRLALGRLTRW